MALKETSTFGLENRVKKAHKNEYKHDAVDNHKQTDDYTHTHEHADIIEPEKKEKKEKRIQLLTYESLVDRMDEYAAKRGVKRVAVFEAAITAYLDMVDPK